MGIESLFGPALTKQCLHAILQSVPVIWTQIVSSERKRTSGPSLTSHLPFLHDHGRGRKEIQLQRLPFSIHLAELEHAGGAALHARRASNTFRVLHRHALVREIHHVDALVTDGGADVARDALLLVRDDREAAEARVDMHESGQRAHETAPDAAGEPEVET